MNNSIHSSSDLSSEQSLTRITSNWWFSDILVINSNDSKSYVILCKFDYNKKLTTDIIVQEKIDKKVQDIENEFIKEKKINFQFKNYE